MTTNAPRYPTKVSQSTLEEVSENKKGLSLASDLATLFGRRDLNKSGGAYVNRLQQMLSETTVGKQSLEALTKNGYLIDFEKQECVNLFNEKSFCASRIDPESKRVFLNPHFSKETNALSLIHAARTVWQMENNARPNTDMTISSYLGAAKVCKADAVVTQMLYAIEMRDKDPKIFEAFKQNGNHDMCAFYEQTGKFDRTAMIDHYLTDMKSPTKISQTQQICYELNAEMYALSREDEVKADLFTKEKTFKEIMNAACKDYDGTTYYQGKFAVDEPARCTIPEKASLPYADHSYDVKWGVLDFMHKHHRTADTLGLDGVKVAYDTTIDMTKEVQKAHDKICWNPRHRGKYWVPFPTETKKAETPAPSKPEPVFHGTIRRHYGGGR